MTWQKKKKWHGSLDSTTCQTLHLISRWNRASAKHDLLKLSCLTYCGAVPGVRRDRHMASWLDSGSFCPRILKFCWESRNHLFQFSAKRKAVYSFYFTSNNFKKNEIFPSNYQFPIWRKQIGRKVFDQSLPSSIRFFILQPYFMSPLCTIQLNSSSLPNGIRHWDFLCTGRAGYAEVVCTSIRS